LKLQASYPEDVALVFKNRPLDFHKQAKLAAMAMQAVLRQDRNKARELHDVMMENRKKLQRADIVGYVEALSLDIAKFEADLDSPEIAAEVDADSAVADKVGARGTPTSFVNGVAVRGAKPYGAFDDVVKRELAEAKKLIAAGTTPADVYEARCKANVAAKTVAA
jgi:protein-disulfide isomerase